MKVKCYDCEAVALGTRGELLKKGWAGADVAIDNKKLKFALCPKHYTAKRVNEIILGMFPQLTEGKK